MSNSYYNNDSPLVAGELARAADLNANNDAIEAGFDAVEAVNVRSLKIPVGEVTDQVLTEDAAARASKLVGFDASGNVVLYAGFTATVASCEAAQSASETAQGLAEDAQTAAETAQGLAEDAQAAAEAAQGLAETAQGLAEDAQGAAELAQGYAQEWAVNAEDVPVSAAAGGDGATTFSAKHWAAKALDNAGFPALTGNAGKSLVVSDDESGVEWGSSYKRLPIFSAEAAAAAPVSVLEDISYGRGFSHGLSVPSYAIEYTTHGLFVTTVFSSNSANIATSPDGETWTLRAMPTTAKWFIGSDGSNLLATAYNSTATAVSTDGGVTWTSATALPGNGNTLNIVPTYLNGTWLVLGAASTTAYISTDFGVTWSTQTLPADGSPDSWGGYFILRTSTTNYYYSTTGLTGSWTMGTFPVLTNSIAHHFDGNLYTLSSAGVYKFTAIDSFEAISGIYGSTALPINGVWAVFHTTFGNSKTYHATGPVTRTSSYTWQVPYKAATNSSGVYVLPSYSNVITLTEATFQTAVFEEV